MHLRNNMKHYNIPIFVPHLGCPHDCVFCNQVKITGLSTDVTPESAETIIFQHLNTLPENADIEVAFFGGSFTGIPVDVQKSLLETAYKYVLSGEISGIRLSTRPDYISEEILIMLKSYGVTTIELGVQSMSNEVLSANERGHTDTDVINACTLIKQYGFTLGVQMMTGMYGSDSGADINTAKRLIALEPDIVRIYPTIVIENTKLCRLYKSGAYTPPSLDETVDLCAVLYKMFTEEGITVIRMGLQSTDLINENAEFIAGPYSSCFGELVLSRIERDKLENMAKTAKDKKLTVYVSPCDISKTVGYKRENIRYIKEKYDIDIEVKSNEFA